MDARTLQALRAAGWTPGRSIGRSEAQKQFAAVGATPTSEQLHFIEEFSGLRVHFRRGDRLDSFWIDVPEAVAQSFEEWVADYSERVADQLVPVGFSNSDHLLLLLGSDASLYGGYDDFFVQLGQGPEESLDWIVWRQDEQLRED